MNNYTTMNSIPKSISTQRQEATVNLNKLRYKVKSLFYSALGLQTDDYDEIETMRLLRQLDDISFLLLTLRRGQKQSPDQPLPLKYHRANLFRRFLVLLLICRCLTLIYFNNSTISILLADPVFNGKDRTLYLFMILIFEMIAALYVEWILYLEEKGRFTPLAHFHHIQSNGFSASYLQMNELQMNSFKRAVHFVLVHFLRYIKFWILIFFLGNMGVRLANPDARATPSLIGYSLFWLPFEGLALVLVYPSACVLIIYDLLIFILYLHKAQSLIDLYYTCDNPAVNLPRSPSIYQSDLEMHEKSTKFGKNGQNIASLNIRVMDFLNEVDHLNALLQTNVFVTILLWSFIADFATFIGLIYHIHSDILSDYFTMIGVGALVALGIICYLAGDLNKKLKYLYVNIERQLTRASVQIEDSFKAMEIFSRLEYQEPGFKAGDCIVLSRDFFLSFILENASLLMLMACDIKAAIIAHS